MLTREENDVVTRVGPGTPMGALLRRFWVPALLSEELPEPDGPPLRVRLLGEDLVTFRDTSGGVGLLAANCPHRAASLFFGRNEEHGLRCVYHGWKFDAEGRCLEMPNEPAESSFRQKVQATAYRCRERGGIIWAYLGPRVDPPDLPALEWNLVPDRHRILTKVFQESNYLQGIEGGIDSSHISFLHSFLGPQPPPRPDLGGPVPVYQLRDRHPRFETVETACGLLIGARRYAEDDSYYWRITPFLLPWYNLIPGSLEPDEALGGHVWVPVDDEHCWKFGVTWRASRPFSDEERATILGSQGLHAEHIPGTYLPLRNRGNDYLLDREQQRSVSYTGITGVIAQDAACQESMGPIFDRTKEHLGTADAAIIAVRRLLLRLVRGLQQGIEPEAPYLPSAYGVRSASVVLPRDVSWIEGAQERLRTGGGRRSILY